MGRNINTGVWTVDSGGYTQIVHDLFTGADPIYTHAEHIDNSFNFCVNGVSEQNSRMCLHMTNRGDNEYNVDSVPNIFIGDLIYDNRGAYSDRVNKILIGTYGGVSNFAIDPNSGSQPASDFKIQPSFDYRNALWYPRIGIGEYNRGSSVSYTYYTLNDLDATSTAVDANPDETWWEYYTRKSAGYVMTLDAYNDGNYYTGGAFQSNSIVEGQTRFGFGPATITWLSSPYYWGYSYGASGCYYYFDNGQGRYSDLTFDVILPLSAEAMTKIDEYDDTWYDTYSNPYPRHVIIYTPKIDKNLVLRLICSYGLPFSFSSSTVGREFADPDYALPVILNNTTTGEYVRGSDCITADTENNRWVNTADIDNKPASGGGGDDNPFDVDAEIYGWGGNEVGGMVRYYLLTSTEMDNLVSAMGSSNNWVIDYLNNIVSCFIVPNDGLFFDAPISTTVKFRVDNNHEWDTGVTCKRISGVVNKSGGTIEIPRCTNSFLDFEPYSDYSIYIPFCGRVPIKGNIVCGREITVTYYPDVPTCSLTAVVTCGGSTVAIAKGQYGSMIPVTSSGADRKTAAAISDVSSIITGLGVGIAGAATGNAGLLIAGGSEIVGGLLNTAKDSVQSYAYSSGSSGDTSFFGAGTRCQYYVNYLQLDDVVNSSEFGHTIGYLCKKIGNLSDFHGFTICANPHIHISATSTEKEEIKSLLEQGVILP